MTGYTGVYIGERLGQMGGISGYCRTFGACRSASVAGGWGVKVRSPSC